MGGIDWAALPIIIEIYGISDVEVFVAKLNAIRDHTRMVQEQKSGR